ncbi:hypothetical protein RhoFasB10_01909 [Rhodococcus sp. B10]|uniref:Uncharacterized protein n=2 Tax=Mycobacteriales TaxID=85007 RepID=A0A177YKL9_9NOCA|nr:hypothetical protein [Rhodococcus sp. B10]OAK56104.1 hypothetical protein A3K89_18095 [Rhodococcus kyotonensis]
MVVGLAVGLLPMVFDYVQQTFFEPEVMYNGVYEPLRGVEMSRAYETSMNHDFDVRSGLFLRRWFVALPVIGSIIGAALGILLHRRGFRLTKQTDG